MEPRNPRRGSWSGGSDSGRGSNSSSSAALGHRQNSSTSSTPIRSSMANAPHTRVRPTGEGASPQGSPVVVVEDKAVASPPAEQATLVQQVMTQVGDAMRASLEAIAAQYGLPAATPSPDEASSRGLLHELQTMRRQTRELQLLVDDLQTEQRVAKERVALYSILTMKLKRELINEKLAHIDTKKEIDELQGFYDHQDGSARGPQSPGGGGPRSRLSSLDQHAKQAPSSSRRGSYEAAADPWTSPNKPSDGSAAGGVPTHSGSASGLPLFGSFYSTHRPSSQADDAEESDANADDDEARSADLRSLRNSLIGQFLPSSLLDSPQLTPTARSVHAMDAMPLEEAGLQASGTESFALPAAASGQDGCDGCGRWRAPVVELVACGHRLCRPCHLELAERGDAAAEGSERQCPHCGQGVQSVQPLQLEDNQAEHRLVPSSTSFAASRPSSSDSTATALSTAVPSTASASVVVSPLTVALLSELFENIPVDELAAVVRDQGGHVAGAMEHLLQRHPAFNPALSSDVVSVMSLKPGAPGNPTRLLGSAGTSTSVNTPSNPNAATSNAASATVGGSNWKTEMCMYYLQGKCNKTRRTCSFAHGESDLVRSSTPSLKHTASTSYKSRLCPLWLDGSCPKSRRECPLAHGENDLRDGLALLGQHGSGGGPAGGNPSASALGGLPALPTTAPRMQNYKTELCYYYLKGCCNFTAEECRFAHGESDLRTVESNTLEWSAQLASGSGVAPSMASGKGAYGLPDASMGGPEKAMAAGSMAPPHQLQHQYLAQFQPTPQQVLAQHASFNLAHAAPFVPQSHGAFHAMQPLPPQSMHAPPPPPHPQHSQHLPPSSYRYLKSMEDAKTLGRRPPPPPQPPRRDLGTAASWTPPGYDHMGPADF